MCRQALYATSQVPCMDSAQCYAGQGTRHILGQQLLVPRATRFYISETSCFSSLHCCAAAPRRPCTLTTPSTQALHSLLVQMAGVQSRAMLQAQLCQLSSMEQMGSRCM
jgi:hypothetical protein